MTEASMEQIRNFRLQSHHLDTFYPEKEIMEVVGACGMQNTPPGAWETALYNRVPGCSLEDMKNLLYGERTLLQAWSLRGIPVIFPASDSGAFLSALISKGDEPWIYTPGILLALDFLQMTFEEVFERLIKVMPKLDETVLTSKTTLDQTLAEWMTPLIPVEKRDLWNQPSMYGSPDKQTVGGAAVSFLLRPCAYCGLVVFGERKGISPTFTSYKNWTGHVLENSTDAVKELVRKYLHCYGPATVESFISWLGCSGEQGRRMWNTAAEEMELVMALGKQAFILSADKARLFSPRPLQRELLLLGGHDPYLDQRDRIVLQPDKSLHQQIWKLVTNPGAVVYRGEIIGIWTGKKKGRDMKITMTLWKDSCDRSKLADLAKEYAGFRRLNILLDE